MILEGKKGLLTKDILKCISYHLSSREDLKDVEYSVEIQAGEGKDRIVVSPYITVFPNIHHRKDSDRRGIAYHVIYHHFSDIFEDASESIVNISKDSLVYGKYIYKKYKLTNRRRWIKQ